MSKIAIVTDSNSGITQNQAKELGVTVIPMPFMFGDITYYEDINMTVDDFFIELEKDTEIHTSQPDPETTMTVWKELLKSHDEVIYIPMSSGLSSSCATAHVLSQEDEFDGKVFVVDNQRISVTQRQSVLDAKQMADQGMSGADIKQRLLDEEFESSIYIMVDTLKYLKKGGRITPAAAAIGTILKIKPVLQIQGEKLDAFAKVKTLKQAKTTMIRAIRKDMETRFGGVDKDRIWLEIAHTKNEEEAELFKQELLEEFPGFDIHMDPLSLSVSCHIGPGSLAVACSKKIEI